MEYKAPRAEDIHYTYNSRGYMMYYKDQPIGGAGIDKSAKGHSSNVRLFQRSAEATKRELVYGGGSQYMKDLIMAIDNAKKEE